MQVHDRFVARFAVAVSGDSPRQRAVSVRFRHRGCAFSLGIVSSGHRLQAPSDAVDGRAQFRGVDGKVRFRNVVHVQRAPARRLQLSARSLRTRRQNDFDLRASCFARAQLARDRAHEDNSRGSVALDLDPRFPRASHHRDRFGRLEGGVAELPQSVDEFVRDALGVGEAPSLRDGGRFAHGLSSPRLLFLLFPEDVIKPHIRLLVSKNPLVVSV